MRNMDGLFAALAKSRFRSRFKLSGREAAYLGEKGLDTILLHARDFVAKRLADAYPINDGRQTPMRNHPVFVAQHATATCCRKCLEKWHHIPRGVRLTETDVNYVIEVLRRWFVSRNSGLSRLNLGNMTEY